MPISIEIVVVIALISTLGCIAILFFLTKSWIHNLSGRIDKLDQRIDRRKMAIARLENNIKNLEAINKSASDSLHRDSIKYEDTDTKEFKDETTRLILKGLPQKTETGTDEVPAVLDERVVKTLYAPNSNSKGEFKEDELNDNPQRNTSFTISILATGDTAIVTLYEGFIFDAGILSTSDQHFGYVSTFDNKWREAYSRLVVIKPGRLRKSDHGWLIQEKIRVRFE